MNGNRPINPPSLLTPTKAFSNGFLASLGNADVLFVSGQLARDGNGDVVAPDDPAEQTRQVFSNLAAVLAEAGMTFADVVKIGVFIVDMERNMAAVSRVRDEFLGAVRPASTMVEVKGLACPSCCVEIEVTAIKRT